MAAAPASPGLLSGPRAPLAALGFLWTHKRLLPLAITPFLINLGLFVLFFWFSYGRFQRWVTAFLPLNEGWWWVLLYYVLAAAAVLLLLVVQVYLFAVVGGVVAAPFLELLTRRVEEEARPGAAGAWSQAGMLAEIARVAGQALKKVLLYAAVMVVLLMLNLLPGLGTLLYAGLAFLVTCFFLALEFLDYPLDRRGLSLAAKLSYVRRAGLSALGFGAAVFALGVVPLVNLLFLPLAAVGGTLLYLEREGEAAPPPPATSFAS